MTTIYNLPSFELRVRHSGKPDMYQDLPRADSSDDWLASEQGQDAMVCLMTTPNNS